MLKMLVSLLQIFSVYSQYTVMPGGDINNHNCIVSAGYTWCESSNDCIRQWETPCEDDFIDCNDCLTKQKNGYNIACPTDCDLVEIEPPIVACPEVMCMMYCEYGNMIDGNGCQICQCNEASPTPEPLTIPNECILWYDGCNTCMVQNKLLSGCTRLMCFTSDNPRCMRYSGH
jgi:hypothetical protein